EGGGGGGGDALDKKFDEMEPLHGEALLHQGKLQAKMTVNTPREQLVKTNCLSEKAC
ncbi:hypothetical protein F66182_71, partial [Fusarium sp. NRRL 66182]